MSQVRIFVSGSSRAFERSTTVHRSQRRHLHKYVRNSTYSRLYDFPVSRNLVITNNSLGTPTTNFVVSSSFVHVRSLSTEPPQALSPAKEDGSSASVLATGTRVKPKVELRPGPAKTPTSNNEELGNDHSKLRSTEDLQKESKFPEMFNLTYSAPQSEELKERRDAGSLSIQRKDTDKPAVYGVLPPPPEGANRFQSIVHKAKELMKFYVNGVKLIYKRGIEVREVNDRVKAGGAPMTWIETKRARVFYSDVRKVVPFLLLAITLEELLPLIAIYFPAMLPSTCVLHSQQEQIENRRHEKQKEAYQIIRYFAGKTEIAGASLWHMDSTTISWLCSAFGIPSWGILGMPRRRLGRHLANIAQDDRLLLKEGKGANLSQEEVAQALWERGIIGDTFDSSQQRAGLRWWLENIESADGQFTDIETLDIEDPHERLRVLADMRVHLLLLLLRQTQP